MFGLDLAMGSLRKKKIQWVILDCVNFYNIFGIIGSSANNFLFYRKKNTYLKLILICYVNELLLIIHFLVKVFDEI